MKIWFTHILPDLPTAGALFSAARRDIGQWSLIGLWYDSTGVRLRTGKMDTARQSGRRHRGSVFYLA